MSALACIALLLASFTLFAGCVIVFRSPAHAPSPKPAPKLGYAVMALGYAIEAGAMLVILILG